LTGAALPQADDDNKAFAISIDLRALSATRTSPC
jgi:hypothetical protein